MSGQTLGDRRFRAVLMDVDGTLYDQRKLRALMALELMALPLRMRSLRSARKTWQQIRCLRETLEDLRGRTAGEEPIQSAHCKEVARRCGLDPVDVEAVVQEWMIERPLRYLWICRRHGLMMFLRFLRSKGVQIGVFSDYPVAEKLRALRVAEYISLALCATDPEINALKPNSRGFLRACEAWEIEASEVLYVGDRPEIDAVGAAASGIACALLSPTRWRATPYRARETCITVCSFDELRLALANAV